MDLKLPGYEREVVEGLARHGLVERSLVSTMYVESLDRLGELEPSLRRGWSVPRVRRNYLKAPLAVRVPVYAMAAYMRARLPALAAARDPLGRLRGDHGAPDPREPPPGQGRPRRRRPALRLDRGRRAAGSARWRRLGVDGVITNDPRLFG